MINLLWTESWKPTKIKKIDILHAEITRHLVKSVSKIMKCVFVKTHHYCIERMEDIYHLIKSCVQQDDKQYLRQSHVYDMCVRDC